ncbi:MAG TPA: diacylglycerol kinase family protein [Candidatus Eremiobacteraceae bacterium]|nr:diacylglycerol kinase family protein [Candidatus Eremiobacteraceae bacterium]
MPGGFVVVANPHAGGGRVPSALRAACACVGVQPSDAVETSHDRSFAERLQRAVAAADRPATVVCVGGDGTLSMVVNALSSPSDVTLAVVPAGSGNDFGMAIGIRTIANALDALAGAHVQHVDLGTINGRRFVNCVGMGLDGEIARTAAVIRARGLARGLSYYIAALLGLWSVNPVGAHIESSAFTGRMEDLLMLTVGNGPWYGGGYRGAPKAELNDSLLDCYAFANLPGGFRRLALMQLIRRGRHLAHPVVTSLLTRTLDVTFDREMAMHIDGELTTASSAHITLIPRGLVFAIPSSAA